ncbi:MAG: hypothetical protein AAF800_10095 [Planctomycetota bacterium]
MRLPYGLLALVCAVVTPPAAAQFVDPAWAEQTEAAIRQHRMADIAVRVLDAEGRIAAGAEVRLTLRRHAFDLAFAVHDAFPEAYDAEAEGWRVFNAVSLAPLTGWRALRPTPDTVGDTTRIDAAIDAAAAHGLAVRWGPVVSGDAFDLPEWAVGLDGPAMLAATRSHTAWVVGRYGGRIDHAETAELPVRGDRLGGAVVRVLGLDHAATPPRAFVKGVRVDGGWWGDGSFDVVAELEQRTKDRQGIAALTVGQAIPARPLTAERFVPGVRRLGRLGLPTHAGPLAIAGPDGWRAEGNAEVVLRAFFAEPWVTGVTFAGLTPAEVDEPTAALRDGDGDPGPSLRAADRLFRQTWWSDEAVTSDELGVASARVFLGLYDVTVTLRDGTTLTVPVRLERATPPGQVGTEIVLMPPGG